MERGRLLHDAIKLEQLNRVIVHVPVNPIKIVKGKIKVKRRKGKQGFRNTSSPFKK